MEQIKALLRVAERLVSVLSVEPWLVELKAVDDAVYIRQCFSALSRAVVGGTLSADDYLVDTEGFSALSRAVVGGTTHSPLASMWASCFSALSRAVVGGTSPQLDYTKPDILFQCSQSSRGWWNFTVLRQLRERYGFSALSRAVVGGTPECSWRPWRSFCCFSALSRAVVGGTKTPQKRMAYPTGFSALSRAVVGGTF